MPQSSKLQGLVNPNESRTTQVVTDMTAQTYDKFLIATTAGATITLPDNPQPAEQHVILAEASVTVTGGLNPLDIDPLFLSAGNNAVLTWGVSKWSVDILGENDLLDVYGDGSDGVAVFDGVGAVFGATLNGGTKTYTITRDVFYSSVTISAGATVLTATTAGSFRLFCRGLLHNSGTLSASGNAAVIGTHGDPLGNGTLGGSFAGGDGAIGVGVGVIGASNTGHGLRGGTGAGGDGGTPTPGTGGTYTPIVADSGSTRTWPASELGVAVAAAGFTTINGAAGGGGGGSSSAGATGGGGGGGGGVMMTAAFALINEASGIINADGGAGGPASGVGNAGGGGGGGGGAIYLISRSREDLGATHATGGAVGAGLGTGTPGNPGANGNIRRLNM